MALGSHHAQAVVDFRAALASGDSSSTVPSNEKFDCQNVRSAGHDRPGKLDASLMSEIIALLQSAERSGTAAIKARSRKLLRELLPSERGRKTHIESARVACTTRITRPFASSGISQNSGITDENGPA